MDVEDVEDVTEEAHDVVAAAVDDENDVGDVAEGDGVDAGVGVGVDDAYVVVRNLDQDLVGKLGRVQVTMPSSSESYPNPNPNPILSYPSRTSQLLKSRPSSPSLFSIL